LLLASVPQERKVTRYIPCDKSVNLASMQVGGRDLRRRAEGFVDIRETQNTPVITVNVSTQGSLEPGQETHACAGKREWT
jgi:hypothetical protein